MSRLKIGDIAPNFNFEGQEEKIIELENLKGKIHLFMTRWIQLNHMAEEFVVLAMLFKECPSIKE